MANDRVDVGLRLYIDKNSEESVKKKINTLKTQIESIKKNEAKLSKEELDIQSKVLRNENLQLKNEKERLNLAIQREKLESAQLTTMTKEYSLEQKMNKDDASALAKKEADEKRIANEREKALQYEQSVRHKIDADIAKANEKSILEENKQLDLQKKKNAQNTKEQLIEEQTTKELQLQLQLFKEQQARNIRGLETGSLQGLYNKTALDDYKASLSALTPETTDLNSKMKVMKSQFANIKSEATASSQALKLATNQTMSLGQAFKSGFEKFSLWMGISTIFYGIVASVKATVETVKELDDAMLELAKVSNLSNEELQQFQGVAFDVAQETGRTADEAIRAISEFKKMGFSLSEATDLGANALVFQNIADGIDSAEEASSVIISTLKGFNMEASESTRIIDALNAVSNKYSVSTMDLAEGVKRTSGVLAQNNTTFDQTIGLLEGGISVLRNAEKVSSGLIISSLY